MLNFIKITCKESFFPSVPCDFGIGGAVGGAMQAAATVAAAEMNLQGTYHTNQTNRLIHQEDNQFNANEAEKNRVFQEKERIAQNEYNSAEQQVQRLKEAGINPTQLDGVANSGSGVSAPSGATASSAPAIPMQAPQIDPTMASQAVGNVIDTAFKAQTYGSNVESAKAQTEQNKALAREMAGKTDVNIDTAFETLKQIRMSNDLTAQQIEESKKRGKHYDSLIELNNSQIDVAKATGKQLNLQLYNIYSQFVTMYSQQFNNIADTATVYQQMRNTMALEQARLDKDIQTTLQEWKRGNVEMSYRYGGKHQDTFGYSTSEQFQKNKYLGFKSGVEGGVGFGDSGKGGNQYVPNSSVNKAVDGSKLLKKLNVAGLLGLNGNINTNAEINGGIANQSINTSGNESSYTNDFISQNAELYDKFVTLGACIEVQTHPDQYGATKARKALDMAESILTDIKKQENLLKIVSQGIKSAQRFMQDASGQ